MILKLISNNTQSKLNFLKKWAVFDYGITTWHLNDYFLEWWRLYYKNSTLLSTRRSLSYYCRLLVKEGFLKPSIKSGIGINGRTDYGINYQTIWGLKPKLTRELIEEINKL